MLIRRKLCTARLRLQPATSSDVPKLHELWGDPDVRRWLWDDRHPDPEDVSKMIGVSDEGFRSGRGGLWLIYSDEVFVGFAGLREAEWQPGEVELLYGLKPEFWGHGYATEAALGVLGAGFAVGLERILAAADVPNEASARVLGRLGMKVEREGELDGFPVRFYSLPKGSFGGFSAR